MGDCGHGEGEFLIGLLFFFSGFFGLEGVEGSVRGFVTGLCVR